MLPRHSPQSIPAFDFSKPLLIHPDAARQLFGLFGEIGRIKQAGGDWNAVVGAVDGANIRNVAFSPPDIEAMQAENRRWSLRDGVATIDVRGPITRYGTWFSDFLGMATVDGLAQQLNEVANDSRVNSLVLNFDSPGGQSNGISDLGEAIYQMRGKKPITAYIDGMGCSAAYWLASACDEIVISASGIAGSIGAVMVLVDDSKMMDNYGLKEIPIISSQSPKKWPDPASKEGRAQYQQLVDASCELFGVAVARNRGVSVEKVFSDFGQGWVFTGQQAVDAGLVDRLGDYENLLNEMAGGGASNGAETGQSFIFAAQAANGGNLMANENQQGMVQMPFQAFLSALGIGGNHANAAPQATPPAAPENAVPPQDAELVALRAQVDALTKQLGETQASATKTAREAFVEAATPKFTPAQLEAASNLYAALATGKATPEMLTAFVSGMDVHQSLTVVPAPVVEKSAAVPNPENASPDNAVDESFRSRAKNLSTGHPKAKTNGASGPFLVPAR